jgi:hypothetical protein
MYRFSRAIYRELADAILEPEGGGAGNHAKVLHACEAAIERLAFDRHYFAHPARTLFRDVRAYFPVSAQHRVYRVVERYLACADEYLSRRAPAGHDLRGNPLQCRATTRRGTACQRIPLAHNGYCPSHQHLAETEDMPAPRLAA